jgi:hypothetical protein
MVVADAKAALRQELEAGIIGSRTRCAFTTTNNMRYVIWTCRQSWHHQINMQHIARQRRPHFKPVKTQQLRCSFRAVTNEHLFPCFNIIVTDQTYAITAPLPSTREFEMRQRPRVGVVAKIGERNHGRDAGCQRARALGWGFGMCLVPRRR